VEKSITHVAMDTHKKQHAVALAYPDTGEVQVFTVKNTVTDIKKMVRKIQRRAPGQVRFCYEAGVCGFTLKQQIEAAGSPCMVIAPSLVPRKQGDRIKTDRRDARKLLGQFIAGQLTEVYAPDPEQEAAREITRCRQAAQEDLKRSRHQLVKFLTRHGYIYQDGGHWTKQHGQWLLSLQFGSSDLREVFDWYYTQLQHCQQRLATLDKEVAALAERPAYREIVGLLRCLRGVDTLTAITVLTELFEFGRFASPRKLMAYLGLVPSEHSSGEKRRPGSITKTGNGRVRRLLIESSWHYRHRPSVSKALKRRRDGQPQWAVDMADRAMYRLHKRYHRLMLRGKIPCKVVVAVARELAGFIWAILHEWQRRRDGDIPETQDVSLTTTGVTACSG
jgi:transposase